VPVAADFGRPWRWPLLLGGPAGSSALPALGVGQAHGTPSACVTETMKRLVFRRIVHEAMAEIHAYAERPGRPFLEIERFLSGLARGRRGLPAPLDLAPGHGPIYLGERVSAQMDVPD